MDISKRLPVIAGNWKMNMGKLQSKDFINELVSSVSSPACEVVVCVPFTNIDTVFSLTENSPIQLGAQNCHWEESGAFTGEISPCMLKEAGVSHVIIGHSERRQYFGETDKTVNLRIKAALSCELTAIVCVGETLEQRTDGKTFDVINSQLSIALDELSGIQMAKIIIAYEPVWAIGTGVTATSEQADEVCSFIRKKVSDLFGLSCADALRILYGGSMNPKNAAELLSKENIDGGLIGGASLKITDFSAIILAASV